MASQSSEGGREEKSKSTTFCKLAKIPSMKGISGEKPKTAAEFNVGVHQALALNGIQDKFTRSLVLNPDLLAIFLVLHHQAAIAVVSEEAAAVSKYCEDATVKYGQENKMQPNLVEKFVDGWRKRGEACTADFRAKAEKAAAASKKPDKEAEEQDVDSESDDDSKGGGLSLLQILQAVHHGMTSQEVAAKLAMFNKPAIKLAKQLQDNDVAVVATIRSYGMKTGCTDAAVVYAEFDRNGSIPRSNRNIVEQQLSVKFAAPALLSAILNSFDPAIVPTGEAAQVDQKAAADADRKVLTFVPRKGNAVDEVKFELNKVIQLAETSSQTKIEDSRKVELFLGCLERSGDGSHRQLGQDLRMWVANLPADQLPQLSYEAVFAKAKQFESVKQRPQDASGESGGGGASAGGKIKSKVNEDESVDISFGAFDDQPQAGSKFSGKFGKLSKPKQGGGSRSTSQCHVCGETGHYATDKYPNGKPRHSENELALVRKNKQLEAEKARARGSHQNQSKSEDNKSSGNKDKYKRNSRDKRSVSRSRVKFHAGGAAAASESEGSDSDSTRDSQASESDRASSRSSAARAQQNDRHSKDISTLEELLAQHLHISEKLRPLQELVRKHQKESRRLDAKRGGSGGGGKGAGWS